MKKTIDLNILLNAAAGVIIMFIMTGCGHKPLVTGEIQGLGDDSVLIAVNPLDFSPDSFSLRGDNVVPAKNGRFILDGELEKPALFTIVPKSSLEKHPEGFDLWLSSRYVNTIVKPGEKINIKGNLTDKVLDAELSGTTYNEELSKLRKLEMPYNIKADNLIIAMEFEEMDDEERNALNEEYYELQKQKQLLYYDYIKENPDMELSASLLAMSLPYDSLETYYAGLGDKVKDGVFKDYLERKLKANEEFLNAKRIQEGLVPGADAPRFTLKTPEGGQLSLTDVKGKYIVLDFWGAWCGWCIKGFPKMKEYYAKYKNRVEFIGIDCGDKEEKWLAALEEHEIPWKNVYEGKENITTLYGITGFPTKILIDKNYKIVEVFVGEGEDFYRKLDELFK